MLRATVKSLLAHKLRLALTALAIVLGVGFVSGTYVLTDTINSIFDDLFKTTTQGTDVQVRTREAFPDNQGNTVREPVPASLEAQIRAVDGVQATQGSVTGIAQLIDKDGKPLSSQAPTIGLSFGPVQDLNGSVVARQGRLPAGPEEAVLDARTAKAKKFAVGDQLKLILPGGPQTFRLVGIVGFGEVDNLAGATIVGFDLPTAQKIFNRKDSYDSIDVVAADGVTAEQLRDRIGAALDHRYEAITGQDLAAETTEQVAQGVGFFTTAMLAFAGVALFVGAFIINNTFSIIVAQRTRELALLRCLGASRRQVLTSVLAEAVLVALLASAVGIGFGVLVALFLRWVFGLIGIDLPSAGVVILPRTIIVAFAVGLVVTVVSALLPARRATKVPPVAALRADASTPPARSFLRRSIVGTIITAGGVAALAAGLGAFGKVDNGLPLVGLGAALTLIGVGALAPIITSPLAGVIGWPSARLRGLPGQLAEANAKRNPRRTAATASALMIGLALVSFVTIFASSVKASVEVLFERAITADYQVSTSTFQPFSPKLAEQLRTRSEFSVVAPFRGGPFKFQGQNKNLIAADPAVADEVLSSDVQSGNMKDLEGGIAVYDEVATANHWTVGSTIPITFPVGGLEQVPVKVIFGDKSVTDSDYILSLADFERDYPPQSQLDQIVLVKVAEGVAPGTARSAIDQVAADYPNVQVQDSAQATREASRSIDQLLALIYVLLALAVVIALIGIVNTLALSIYERVRELGLLRAVGMDRRQVRIMIRWESVIIAVLGALLGLGVGIFFGWALVRALGDQGITEFTIPFGQLALFVLFAGVAGILAAVLPGRRASRVDVLRALAAE
jgi:putative ABC transport system permease protein